jgi:hypothetical protein
MPCLSLKKIKPKDKTRTTMTQSIISQVLAGLNDLIKNTPKDEASRAELYDGLKSALIAVEEPHDTIYRIIYSVYIHLLKQTSAGVIEYRCGLMLSLFSLSSSQPRRLRIIWAFLASLFKEGHVKFKISPKKPPVMRY